VSASAGVFKKLGIPVTKMVETQTASSFAGH